MTRRIGWSVTLRIRPSSFSASGGVASASNTTTPSRVTTKPAFDMKPWFSLDAAPDSPCTK